MKDEKKESGSISVAEQVMQDVSVRADANEFISLQHRYNAAIKEITTRLEILDTDFKIKYDHNPIHHIESRLKGPQSIYGKLKKKGLPISVDSIKENIMDVAGVRVICNYVEDIERIAMLLLQQNDVRLVKMKDYVNNPKENGYRSLHLVVKIPIYLAQSVEETPVEIQIRTIAMDFWASLEHQLKYKSGEEVSAELGIKLKACAERIAGLDAEMQDIHRQINGKEADCEARLIYYNETDNDNK